MKKRIACALLAALCLGACALGEDSCWTRNADFYYHAYENCGGGENRVPISEEAARAFDKYACPVCVPDADEGQDVRAAFRGGTIVVRFSDAWLGQQELTGVFGWSSDSVYGGKRAQNMLGQYLHGSAYADFMHALRESGAAQGRSNTPHILAADGALVMSKRHIGSSWYVIVRPKEAFEETWDMYWRVSSLRLEMEKGVLRTSFDLQTIEESRTLTLESMNGSAAVYQRTGDGLELAVYPALDGSIAVIREKNVGGRQIEGVQLCISGLGPGIEMSGYMEGGDAVYCCALTDAELAAVKNNDRLEIRRVQNVTSGVYRVEDEQLYSYYTIDDDTHLFNLEKAGDRDPADGSFRLILSGEPDCFAVQTDGADYIMDYDGNQYHPGFKEETPERITPLVWSGETGVFLAESDPGEGFAVGELLLTGGIEPGVRYALERDMGDGNYHCWLMDETGNTLLGGNKSAFTVHENGEIHMENTDGGVEIYYGLTAND